MSLSQTHDHVGGRRCIHSSVAYLGQVDLAETILVQVNPGPMPSILKDILGPGHVAINSIEVSSVLTESLPTSDTASLLVAYIDMEHSLTHCARMVLTRHEGSRIICHVLFVIPLDM